MTQQQPGDQRPQDETAPVGAVATAPPTTAPSTPPPAYAPSYDVTPQPAKRSLRSRLGRVPRAAWLSAAAVIVVVGVGLGGFFVGRATAPDDAGFPGGPGQRPDFGGGQMPGNGEMPEMPGQQGRAPGAESDGSTDGSTDSSADTTSWYVVPAA